MPPIVEHGDEGGDFRIVVRSDGLTMIICNRPLDRKSLDQLRDLLGRIGGAA